MDIDYKAKVKEALLSVNRFGMDKFVEYLEKDTDYFTAPASTVYHLNYPGGLVQHSWNVYELLKHKVEYYKVDASPQTIAICGLLHDMCKVNFYALGKKWKKDDTNGTWKEIDVWKVEDQFPIGHGEKSVIVTQRFIQLTDEEVLAIRWHLGMADPGNHFNYPSGFPFRQAVGISSLVTLLHTADMEATYMLEAEKKTEEEKEKYPQLFG